MSIAALTTYASDTTSTSSSTTTSSAYDLTSSDFMTLLLTQLENQDPTDPTDMDQFTSQLCSLNQLQQATETNGYLEELVSSSSSSDAVSYIGKTITYEDDSLSVSDGTADALTFNLADDASDVTITIYDSDGDAVTSMSLSDVSSGTSTYSWDGTDSSGDTVEDGDYTYEVTATDSSGDSVTATTYSTASVTGLVYEDGTPYLIADGEEISLDDVTGVYQS